MTAQRITLFRLTCDGCGDSIAVEGRTMREARKVAEDDHTWFPTTPGIDGWLCPKHDPPCPHCLQSMPRDVALDFRQRKRAEWKRQEATRGRR